MVDLFCLLRSDIGMATEGARAPVHVGEPRRTEGVRRRRIRDEDDTPKW